LPLTYSIDRSWTHAGGVAYRAAANGPELLLVRAKPEPHDWVLPKGHIERSESPDACARRELREEAGVDAEPLAYLGDDRFTTPQGKHVRAAFFLLRYLKDVPADDDRECRWCSIDEALRLIQFSGARRIIRSAQAHLT
jgi:ADP-ribose pyrophosphatase YjhB (NUDIX family)